MKIQLDTEQKTIKLESEVLLSKLIETLNKLLPNGEWKKFTLETNTTITHWHEPIIVRETRPYWGPWYGSLKTTAEYKVNKSTDELSLKSGIYNVEC